MATSKAQKLATANYRNKTYDNILFRVKKGKRDEYKQAAAIRNIGFHEMIRNSIDEYIQNHPPKEE